MAWAARRWIGRQPGRRADAGSRDFRNRRQIAKAIRRSLEPASDRRAYRVIGRAPRAACPGRRVSGRLRTRTQALSPRQRLRICPCRKGDHAPPGASGFIFPGLESRLQRHPLLKRCAKRAAASNSTYSGPRFAAPAATQGHRLPTIVRWTGYAGASATRRHYLAGRDAASVRPKAGMARVREWRCSLPSVAAPPTSLRSPPLPLPRFDGHFADCRAAFERLPGGHDQISRFSMTIVRPRPNRHCDSHSSRSDRSCS